jgi:hypothetical protein
MSTTVFVNEKLTAGGAQLTDVLGEHNDAYIHCGGVFLSAGTGTYFCPQLKGVSTTAFPGSGQVGIFCCYAANATPLSNTGALNIAAEVSGSTLTGNIIVTSTNVADANIVFLMVIA